MEENATKDAMRGAAPWAFSLGYEVRDYELDLQGIVNNSVYLNYFEHARHSYLRAAGVDWAQMHENGLDAVVYRIEIDYLSSLRSGEKFEVRVRTEMKGRLRIVFIQEAVKESGVLAARTRVETVITKAGKPVPPESWMSKALFGEPR